MNNESLWWIIIDDNECVKQLIWNFFETKIITEKSLIINYYVFNSNLFPNICRFVPTVLLLKRFHIFSKKYQFSALKFWREKPNKNQIHQKNQLFKPKFSYTTFVIVIHRYIARIFQYRAEKKIVTDVSKWKHFPIL